MAETLAQPASRSFRIRSDERVGLVGKTGSGKTYAAERLLAPVRRLVVADPKGNLRDRWGLAEPDGRTARALDSGEPVRVRYGFPADGDWDSVFQRVYEAGDVTLYVDEAYGVLKSGRPTAGLTACYTRGREMGVSVWTATQRPAWVPLFMLSESDWYLMFRVQLAEDRKRMAQLIGPAALRTVRGHAFWLYHTSWDGPVYYKKVSER